MINERKTSRRFSKRKSIISSHEVNEEEKTSTIYHIENLKQLRDWIREDSEVISFMIQKLRKNNDIIIDEYNMIIKKHDHLFNLYQALLNKIVNQNENVSIKFVHDEDTSKSKLIIFKKLLDFSIFIDEKNLLIDDWLSIMRNKLKENAN
jgi:hypothetical protein